MFPKLMVHVFNKITNFSFKERKKKKKNKGYKVEFYQPSYWLYSVPNLLVF